MSQSVLGCTKRIADLRPSLPFERPLLWHEYAFDPDDEAPTSRRRPGGCNEGGRGRTCTRRDVESSRNTDMEGMVCAYPFGRLCDDRCCTLDIGGTTMCGHHGVGIFKLCFDDRATKLVLREIFIGGAFAPPE
jgi:hypothetical protein